MKSHDEIMKWQEREALDRFRMISPLLDPEMDNSKRIQLRESIACTGMKVHSAIMSSPDLSLLQKAVSTLIGCRKTSTAS